MLENIERYNPKSAIFSLAASWKKMKITVANVLKIFLFYIDPDFDICEFEAGDFHQTLQGVRETNVSEENVFRRK